MKTLKKVGLGLISAVALASAAPAAFAADIYRDEGSIKDVAPVDYAPSITWTGFYIGANVGATWDDSDDVDILDDATLIGGGHLGYNWQGPSNFVVGLEGDVEFLEDVDYLATIRGRLGYAFGPTLAYATGGAAFIDLGDEFDDTGWVAGLGVEHKIRDNVSFGVEGLYYDFEGVDSDDAQFWAARARLTYHFGGSRY
jgi:outer membrane immunogenic protein